MCMLKYLLIKSKKIFECFICFLKWFYTFVILVFVQNAFLCFSSKTGSEVFSREACNLELSAKCAYGKFQSHIFIQKVLLLPREYFTTKLFSWNVLGKNWKFSSSYRGYRDCLMTVSWLKASHEKLLTFSGPFRDCIVSASLLPNPRKMHFFSFYVVDVTCFQNHLISLA